MSLKKQIIVMKLWMIKEKKKVFINKIGIKERKIADVLEKVGLWRKLYDGFHDENGR